MTSVDEVLEELPEAERGKLLPVSSVSPVSPTSPAGASPEKRHAVPFSPDEKVLWALLEDADNHHVDDLAERAPFGIARLQTALLGLELKRVVVNLPGGHYRRRDR